MVWLIVRIIPGGKLLDSNFNNVTALVVYREQNKIPWGIPLCATSQFFRYLGNSFRYLSNATLDPLPLNPGPTLDPLPLSNATLDPLPLNPNNINRGTITIDTILPSQEGNIVSMS